MSSPASPIGGEQEQVEMCKREERGRRRVGVHRLSQSSASSEEPAPHLATAIQGSQDTERGLSESLYRGNSFHWGWLTVSEGQSVIIMAGSMVAGRHGAREVAESFTLICKQRQKEPGPGVDF